MSKVKTAKTLRQASKSKNKIKKSRKMNLDPVTFEVLKNSYITTVDQMAEQILRTCYSFVIYNRDFSS